MAALQPCLVVAVCALATGVSGAAYYAGDQGISGGPLQLQRLPALGIGPDPETAALLMHKYRPVAPAGDWLDAPDPRLYLLTENDMDDAQVRPQGEAVQCQRRGREKWTSPTRRGSRPWRALTENWRRTAEADRAGRRPLPVHSEPAGRAEAAAAAGDCPPSDAPVRGEDRGQPTVPQDHRQAVRPRGPGRRRRRRRQQAVGGQEVRLAGGVEGSPIGRRRLVDFRRPKPPFLLCSVSRTTYPYPRHHTPTTPLIDTSVV